MGRLIVSTAVIQCSDEYAVSDFYRMRLLKDIIGLCKYSDIILFPAGFFSGDLQYIEKKITDILRKEKSSAVVCVGADYRDGDDQLAYAIGPHGVIAAGRKFYPTAAERGIISLAPDYLAQEDGKDRIFQVNGLNCYLAVCYDCFGIRHLSIENPGVDICLDLIHSFYRRGYGASGDVDFARKGFTGASAQWQCPVFGTGVFFGRNVPENWPTGVLWTGSGSVKSFKYADNQMRWTEKSEVRGNVESAIIYKYIMDG